MISHWTLIKSQTQMIKNFIGINDQLTPPSQSTSLLLRRSFNVRNIDHKFILSVIGLGIAIYYINGKRITNNVLSTSTSDYSKTLYLDKYDVTNFIKKGKNVIAIELGNGFYNESIKTVWNINQAHWRGEKCLFLRLKADNKTILKSDEKFKAIYSPFTIYNELRAGEWVDQRKVINFSSLKYNDDNWEYASFIKNPPTGKIKENICPPIKEFETIKPINIIQNKRGFVYDFGKNFSGYIKATISEQKDKEIVFKYAEDISENGELELHGLDCYQKDEPFQIDKCITNGSSFVFKPKFTYHGFRYVQVSGIDDLKKISLEGIFIHQDIKYLKPKYKLNGIYKKIFDAGINSILSNTYYGFTDCPTREKLNWTNDLSASLPVIMKYFDAKNLLMKVYQDIIDAQDVNGNVPGIVPSPNWGYEYGPVCGGIIITLPYHFYKKYGDRFLFDNNLYNIKKYYRFVKKNLNADYFFLADWTGSTNHPKTPKKFVLETCMFIFDKILWEMTGKKEYKNDLLKRKKSLCSYKIEGQTIPSILLALDLGKKQDNLSILLQEIKKTNYHIDVGVFGFQYLFKALSDNKCDDIIYKMLCNPTPPSFKTWIDNGATTLYETFGETWTLSMNHHMFSCVIQYLK